MRATSSRANIFLLLFLFTTFVMTIVVGAGCASNGEQSAKKDEQADSAAQQNTSRYIPAEFND